MTPKDAEKYNLKDGQDIAVKISDKLRSLIFGNVVVRVSEKFSLACHIDTDEANAAGIKSETFGEMILKSPL